MAEETTARPDRVVRYYTRARKFPQLIGKTPDGTKIPFGPYTITQAVVAGSALIVGFYTLPMWAGESTITNVFVLIAMVWGVVRAVGRIPAGARSPLSVATGAYRAAAAPRTGRVAGRPVRIARPHHVVHRMQILTSPSPTEVVTEPAPIAVVEATRPAPAEAAPTRQLSGVQLLLAQKGTR